MKKVIAVILATWVPIGSASAGEWRKTKAASAAKMAQLRCEAASIGIDSSVVAYGSSEFVAGAIIGHAIGEAIDRTIFVNRCMKAQGYEYVKSRTQKKRDDERKYHG